MNCKAVLLPLAAVFISSLRPAIGGAQQVGLRIGVAPGQVASSPPAQAPVVAVGNALGIPTIIVPAIPPAQLVPNFPTVITPNRVLMPGQTIVPTTPILQGSPGGPPSLRQRRPAPGTPRADVLRQFGQPSVTIITSTGETLYFTGGVTVILQNGQVAGTR